MTLDVYCGRKTTIQPKKSNNLAILLATSDTTADQTAPSNQGLQDKLFCGFKQTQKKIQWWFNPKYWAEIFKHILCIQIILLHLIQVYAIFYSFFSINLAIFYQQYLIQQLYSVPIFSVTIWCVDHSKGDNYHFMTNIQGKFVFKIVPATYNCLSESILWRCTKCSLGKEFKNYPLQCHTGSLNNLVWAKIIKPRQFITYPLKSSRIINHTLKHLDN